MELGKTNEEKEEGKEGWEKKEEEGRQENQGIYEEKKGRVDRGMYGRKRRLRRYCKFQSVFELDGQIGLNESKTNLRIA